MDLRHRGAGNGYRVEMLEDLVDRFVVGTLERAISLFDRKRRDLILQFSQFIGNVKRHQVAARGQHLAEFDENRSKCFQCKPQTLTARPFEAAPEQDRRQQRTQSAHAFMAEEKFVEPVA